MFEGPAVDAVVGGVEASLREPCYIACFESARSDGVEGAIPVQSFPRSLDVTLALEKQLSSNCYLCPPGIGMVTDGLCVCGAVSVDVRTNMGSFVAVGKTGSNGVSGYARGLFSHKWESGKG